MNAHTNPGDGARHQRSIPQLYRIGASIALTALAGSMLYEEPWTLSTKDAVYWFVVASMIVARYIDERVRAVGRRGVVARAVWRYSFGLVVAAGLVWTIAQLRSLGASDESRLTNRLEVLPRGCAARGFEPDYSLRLPTQARLRPSS
ncbi:MAG: hypothetical protein ACKVWV_02110 [Planctomycetota bacterium]